MDRNDGKQRNRVLGAAMGAVFGLGSLGLAGSAWSQQPDEPRTESAAAAEAARELREAQQQVQDAGQQVSEARSESQEAVRQGREAGRAAQRAEEQRMEERLTEEQRTDQQRTDQQRADQLRTEEQRAAGRDRDDAASRGSVDTDEEADERTRTAAAGGAAAAANAQRGSAAAPDAVWQLVPADASRQAERQSNDCWVRLYSSGDFGGRYITITGPAEIPQLRSPYGTGLNSWESAVVGSNATVMTYDDDNFEKRSATLRGGEKYRDLGDSSLGLFRDIESLRVTCDSSGSGAGSSSQSDPADRSTPPRE
jgi:hypothetical protein